MPSSSSLSAPDEGPFAYHRQTLGAIIDEMEVMDWTLERLSEAVHGLAMAAVGRAAAEGEPREDQPPEGSYGYIPIRLPELMARLRELDAALAADADYRVEGMRYRPVRFIELGSGHGRNLAVLRECEALHWVSLAGIDISPRMVALGQAAFGLQEELAVGDVMTADLSQYDVVYTYRPFSDDRLQRKFEKHLVSSMRVSAYLVAPLNSDLAASRRLLAVGSSGNLFKKIA